MKTNAFAKPYIKVLIAAALFILLGLCWMASAPAHADWPQYGSAYTLPGLNDVTIVFHQPMQSDSPLYHGTGLATISYPAEETNGRGAVGTPYREVGSVEHVDVIYYVFNDLWPDDYTIFFSFEGADFEFDFSDDKAEAVRIHPDAPIKLTLPSSEADAQIYGGGDVQ